MPRWEPHAADRLAQAALELFAERGYDDTTVIDIAQRAGLGKTTFFRHFADKREVLFGGARLDSLLVAAITAAPATATPLQAVAHALDAAGDELFTPGRREFVARRQALIAAHPALQEREALKNVSLIASMVGALRQRGIANLTARVAAELGALAFTIAYEHWCATSTSRDFGQLAQHALAEVLAHTQAFTPPADARPPGGKAKWRRTGDGSEGSTVLVG